MSIYKVWYDETAEDFFFEAWGASTKHPDRTAQMRKTKGFTVSEDIHPKYQVFQWLLYLASESAFPFHAESLVEYALENWRNWK